MRISFISKVTRVQKGTTVTNDTRLCLTILVLFLAFHPGQPGRNFPYEQTTKFVPVTEPARLPGSYEEALSKLLVLGFLQFKGNGAFVRGQNNVDNKISH